MINAKMVQQSSMGNQHIQINKKSAFNQQLSEYRHFGLPLSAIRKLINPQLEKPLSYQTYKYFVQHELTDATALPAR